MFDRIQSVMPDAFNNVKKAIHPKADEDLDLYNSLGVNDFSAIADKYGTDKMVEYVEAMEKRKLVEE